MLDLYATDGLNESTAAMMQAIHGHSLSLSDLDSVGKAYSPETAHKRRVGW